MKKLIILLMAFIAIIFAENIESNSSVVDDNISIDQLIIDDGSEVINNQDTEKPQDSN